MSLLELVRTSAAAHAARQAEPPETRERRRLERITRERAEAQRDFEASREPHLRSCGLRDREVDAVVRDLGAEWAASRAAAAWWADKERRILLVGGVVGSGKTLAAARLFDRLVMRLLRPDWGDGASEPRRYGGRYELAASLADEPPFDPRTARLDSAREHSPLTVVDELGAEKAVSGPWLARFDALVDAFSRRTSGKLMLVTNLSVVANVGADGKPERGADGKPLIPFRERYGARTWRRVVEFGTVLALPCAACARGSPDKECRAAGHEPPTPKTHRPTTPAVSVRRMP